MTAHDASRRAELRRTNAAQSIYRIATGLQQSPHPSVVPCKHRSPSPVGKLVCNCSEKPDAFGCQAPENKEGSCCILEPLQEPWDGFVAFGNGFTSTSRYIPWHDRADQKPIASVLRMPVCTLCPWRQTTTSIDWSCMPKSEATPDCIGPDELVYITTERLAADTLKLLRRIPSNLQGIVGIPRSGMIPATILATALDLPLYSIDVGVSRELQLSYASRNRGQHEADGSYLYVDDSSFSGVTMDSIRGNLLRASVYASDPAHVDFYAVHHQGPHLFQWNIWNNRVLHGSTVHPLLAGGFATDLDGVLCEDPPYMDMDSNEEAFLKWAADAPPLNIPRAAPIPVIITLRIEKWREVTEKWLAKWGIKYDSLRMFPAETVEERAAAGHSVFTWKADEFSRSSASIMFESSDVQARLIANISRKPVIVPSTGSVYH